MWVFKQIGTLLTPEGPPSAHSWFSGHAEHAGKPADEGLVGLGPLPRGTYTFGDLKKDTHMGPVAIHLVPDAATRAYIISLGRDPDSFYAHAGDRQRSHLSSQGCLVSMDGVAPVMSLWSSLDWTLKCISGIEDPVKPIT